MTVQSIWDSDGKCNTCGWQWTEVACISTAASIPFPGTVLTLGFYHGSGIKGRNEEFSGIVISVLDQLLYERLCSEITKLREDV